MTRVGGDLKTLLICEFIVIANTESVVRTAQDALGTPIARTLAISRHGRLPLPCERNRSAKGCWHVTADIPFRRSTNVCCCERKRPLTDVIHVLCATASASSAARANRHPRMHSRAETAINYRRAVATRYWIECACKRDEWEAPR